MQKTISRFTSSLAALLTDQTTVIDADGRTENIRTEMLRALYNINKPLQTDNSTLRACIERAVDIQTLWYLRSDLLRQLSNFHGEQLACPQLAAITEMFRGIVHKSQMPTTKRFSRQ